MRVIKINPCFFDINLAAEITDANGNRISTIDTYLTEEGMFQEGDERTYVFEYNGTRLITRSSQDFILP